MKPEPINIRLNPKYQQQLLARGMNRLALTVRPFKLKPSSFTASVEGLKPKHIDADQQIEWYRKLIEKPFSKPWCFCITSDPNDRMAKMAAAYVMQQALRQSTDRFPLWHNMMSSFDNPIISEELSRPNLLIISNVLPNSTATKFEKLRDILEYHSRIPRIVVSAGDNPFSFFQKYLYYPLNGCVYLKSGMMKSDVEI
jgi:hypothetical protein